MLFWDNYLNRDKHGGMGWTDDNKGQVRRVLPHGFVAG